MLGYFDVCYSNHLLISLVADSFNSLDHQRMCTESGGHASKELEFRSLTILTFLQTSFVQSMSVSHKDISPVSQYDGLQVSVEYVDNRERCSFIISILTNI